METKMTNSEVEKPDETSAEGGDQTLMDEAISMVESYIQSPVLATLETLGMLKLMLKEMKPMIDGDDREGMEDASDEETSDGISAMIGKMKNKEGE